MDSSSPTSHAPCCMLHAVCSMLYAPCSMLYAPCCMLHAVCSVWCDMCRVSGWTAQALCRMLHAVCYAVGCIRIPNKNHRLMNWGSVSTDGMLSSSSTSTSTVNFWFQVEMRRIREKICRRHPLTANSVGRGCDRISTLQCSEGVWQWQQFNQVSNKE